MSSPPALRRNLSARQLQLMALGSTIGVGLFLGSATAIELAGPSILLAYAVAGLITFIVLRALGARSAASRSRHVSRWFGPATWRTATSSRSRQRS